MPLTKFHLLGSLNTCDTRVRIEIHRNAGSIKSHRLPQLRKCNCSRFSGLRAHPRGKWLSLKARATYFILTIVSLLASYGRFLFTFGRLSSYRTRGRRLTSEETHSLGEICGWRRRIVLIRKNLPHRSYFCVYVGDGTNFGETFPSAGRSACNELDIFSRSPLYPEILAPGVFSDV